MIGKTQERFWKCLDALLSPVQKLAKEMYAQWKQDPRHPSPGTAGVQNGAGTWNKAISNWSYSTQNFGWVDTYDATFGTGTDAAGVVTLGENLGVGDIVFNAAGSGSYEIADGGNTLTLKSDAILTANAEATVSAALAGASFTKNGAQRPILSNANAITGMTNIEAGNLRIQNAGALGTGGFNAATMTIVADGGALEIDTNSTTTISEHIALSGIGVAGQGSLVNVSGDNTLTAATRLDADARIRVLTASTLRAQSFFSQSTSTYQLVRTGSGFLTVNAALNVGSLRINGGTTHLLANAAASSKLTGVTELASGSLQINHEAALGTGAIAFSGGTFGGLRTLTGASAYAGTTAVNAGTLAGAVAQFGMLLRDSEHKGSANWSSTNELAIEGQGEDPTGYRAEFLDLVKKVQALQPNVPRCIALFYSEASTRKHKEDRPTAKEARVRKTLTVIQFFRGRESPKSRARR